MLKGRRSIVFLPTNRKITTIGGFVIREFATRAALEGKNPKIFNQSLFLFMLLFLVNSLRLENLRPKLSGEAKIWKFSTRVCYFYSIITFIYIFFFKELSREAKIQKFSTRVCSYLYCYSFIKLFATREFATKVARAGKNPKIFNQSLCFFFQLLHLYI